MSRYALNVALAVVVSLSGTRLLAESPALGTEPDEGGGCSACVEECGPTNQWSCINQCYGTTDVVPGSCAFSIFPCVGYPGHYRVRCA